MLHDTPAFTLIMFMLQITYEMKDLTLLLLAIVPKDSSLHEFLGVAFSLIVIMLQANSLNWEHGFPIS